MAIKAFGREVDRKRAYEIIVNDWINDVCYAGDPGSLEELLFDGWKSLLDQTDEELEDYISTLMEENQPGGDPGGPSPLLT